MTLAESIDTLMSDGRERSGDDVHQRLRDDGGTWGYWEVCQYMRNSKAYELIKKKVGSHHYRLKEAGK